MRESSPLMIVREMIVRETETLTPNLGQTLSLNLNVGETSSLDLGETSSLDLWEVLVLDLRKISSLDLREASSLDLGETLLLLESDRQTKASQIIVLRTSEYLKQSPR